MYLLYRVIITMKNSHLNHYVVMFIIMILSGLLSTMNMWVDKLDDIRLSINDLYMTLLMTGWMFLFMGLFYKDLIIFCFGLTTVIIIMICIRTQFLISETQYKLGMIPHHSMAVYMSKKILEKENTIDTFAKSIINTQNKELLFLKS